MIASQLWMHGWGSALFNHLWQSTAVAIVAWLLTVALRSNSARVRYFIWLLASIKFLVPFKLLADIGAHWAKPAVSAGPRLYIFVEEFSRPFQQSQLPVPSAPASAVSSHSSLFIWAFVAIVWLCGCIVLLARWISDWRRAGALVRNAQLSEEGREFDALRRALRRANIRTRVALRLSACEIEPGVSGILRHTLLWPAKLSDRLDEAHIESIMGHEVEHIGRRDNLTCAIHALVETLFWFHPLVRWMSKKMTEERERACDEKVIQQNARPEAYAESILKVCGFCLEPPAACISGVSGADLKERILRIMARRSGVALSLTKKLMLSAAGISALLLPVGFGVLHGQSISSSGNASSQSSTPDLPKFDVATFKPTAVNDNRHMIMMRPDGISLSGMELQRLLQLAFGVERDRIVGAPKWVQSNRYDIEAKIAPEDASKMSELKMDQRREMLLPLLAERLNLKYHHEIRELPTYALVVAKGGPKLTESKPGESMLGPDGRTSVAPPGGGLPPPGAPGPIARPDGPPRAGNRAIVGEGMRMNPGSIDAHGGTIEFLAHALSGMLGRTVVDKTGLTGNYDFSLNWTPDEGMRNVLGGPQEGPGEAPPDAGGPTLFTALQEQLGLKLESQKSKVDVIVIDHIDLPSGN